MAEQKKIEPLTGAELTHRVKELGNLSKSEKAKVCGYYSVTKNGLERANMKQFLNALLDAEGVELDGNSKAKEHPDSGSYKVNVQLDRSTDSSKILTVKRALNSTTKPQLLSQRVQQLETEPNELPKMELPEQPELVSQLESLAEPNRDESVYGSGWSLAQLMKEFGIRESG